MRERAKADWPAIRHRYENTRDSIARICEETGVTPGEFSAQRLQQKWRRKPPVGQGKVAAKKMTTVARLDTSAKAARTQRRKPPATPAARRRLLARLAAAIALKLEQLERRMESDLEQPDTASATDHERETRAIGALIDNLGKIEEMEGNLGRGRAGKTAAATDLADDADRYRRELAQRLQRIVEASGRKP